VKWRAVVFDRDGTLFDSLAIILDSFNYGAKPFVTRQPTDAEWFAAFGPPEPEVLGAFVPALKKREAFNRFYEYYTAHINNVKLFDGVEAMLHRLKKENVKIALFTGGGLQSTEFCLKRERIFDDFDLLITGDDVRRPKPNPEGIFKAIDAFQVLSGETLVVGDAGADVLAGKHAGAVTVLARWAKFPPPHDLPSQPDYTFSLISDFEAFLFH
jgi:pyrophosphatase PpaX